MKYLVVFVSLLLVAMHSSRAYATDTNIILQILPLECSFDIVNDGNNTIHYITPIACGQLLPPSVNPTIEPTVIQGEQPNQSRIFLQTQKNSIQETSPTIIDNGTEVIGIPSPTPYNDTKKPITPPPRHILMIILGVTLIIVLAVVLVENIFGVALIAPIAQFIIHTAMFFRTIIKTILRGIFWHQ